MIETEDLGRAFGKTIALQHLNLRVEAGEIVGLLGPNGAGKSTTVKILAGLLRPTWGRAMVAGCDVALRPLEAKRRLGYVPEQPAVYEALTALEFLEVIAALHHLEADAAAARGCELLELLGLAEARHQRLAEFSKGMKQKVVLAAALLHRPDVLILDEPLDGLDANSARIVKALLLSLAAQGRAILFCSHVLEIVERLCTRIVILDRGRQVAAGTPAGIAASLGAPTLEEAFARVTGGQDAGRVSGDILRALDRG